MSDTAPASTDSRLKPSIFFLSSPGLLHVILAPGPAAAPTHRRCATLFAMHAWRQSRSRMVLRSCVGKFGTDRKLDHRDAGAQSTTITPDAIALAIGRLVPNVQGGQHEGISERTRRNRPLHQLGDRSIRRIQS